MMMVLLALLALGTGGQKADKAAPQEKLVLLTMSPGTDAVTRFGHAALCVVSSVQRRGDCFNYGHTATNVGFRWRILKGEARFFVRHEPFGELFEYYKRLGRGVWAQTISSDPAVVQETHARMLLDARMENAEYGYEPFAKNCTTRVRDILNEATSGHLYASTQELSGQSYRTSANLVLKDPFLGTLPMDLLLGPGADRNLTRWQSMYLPRNLRGVMTKLGFAPQLLSASRVAPSNEKVLSERGSLVVLLLAAAMLVLLARIRKLRVANVCILALALGAGGTALWTMLLLISHSLAWQNYSIVLLTPFDGLLILLIRRAPPRWLLRYAWLRVMLCTAVLVGVLLGLIPQPLMAVSAFIVLALACLILSNRQGAS